MMGTKSIFLTFFWGWALIITFLLILPGSNLPQSDWFSVYHVDKVVHIFLWGVWMIFGWLSFEKTAGKVAFAIVLYGFLLECIQDLMISHRFFDLGDVLANGFGVFMAYWGGHRLHFANQGL